MEMQLVRKKSHLVNERESEKGGIKGEITSRLSVRDYFPLLLNQNSISVPPSPGLDSPSGP